MSISIQLPVETYQELSLYRNALCEVMYEAELGTFALKSPHKLALLELLVTINQAQDVLAEQGGE